MQACDEASTPHLPNAQPSTSCLASVAGCWGLNLGKGASWTLSSACGRYPCSPLVSRPLSPTSVVADLPILHAQSHPFFNGVDWDRLYSQRPPYTPVVTHELDTSNFENFEVRRMTSSSSCLTLFLTQLWVLQAWRQGLSAQRYRNTEVRCAMPSWPLPAWAVWLCCIL